jgi:hypothetical protein
VAAAATAAPSPAEAAANGTTAAGLRPTANADEAFATPGSGGSASSSKAAAANFATVARNPAPLTGTGASPQQLQFVKDVAQAAAVTAPPGHAYGTRLNSSKAASAGPPHKAQAQVTASRGSAAPGGM